MGLRKSRCRILLGGPEENNHMDHVDLKSKIILK